MLMQPIEHGEVALAGHAEAGVDALRDQRLDEGVAGEPGHVRPSFDAYVGRSPGGSECRGSKPACAGLGGMNAIRVSRMARAGPSAELRTGLGAARRSARDDEVSDMPAMLAGRIFTPARTPCAAPGAR